MFLSVDPLVNLGEANTFNPYSYAVHNPLTMADPSGLSPTGQGNDSAHDTAVALRMQALAEIFPGAVVSGDIGNAFGGADVICWNCAPGEVWIWEVKPINASQADVEASLKADLKDTEKDPRAAGKSVKLGADFGTFNEYYTFQTSANLTIDDQLVIVFDVGREGVQRYSTGTIYPPSAKHEYFNDKANRVKRDSSRLNRDSHHWTFSRKYRDKNPTAIPPPSPPASTPSRNRPKISDEWYGPDPGGCTACQTSTYGAASSSGWHLSDNDKRTIGKAALYVGVGVIGFLLLPGLVAYGAVS